MSKTAYEKKDEFNEKMNGEGLTFFWEELGGENEIEVIGNFRNIWKGKVWILDLTSCWRRCWLSFWDTNKVYIFMFNFK